MNQDKCVACVAVCLPVSAGAIAGHGGWVGMGWLVGQRACGERRRRGCWRNVAPAAEPRPPLPRRPAPCRRAKQEAALRSTQAQREALDRRVAEQERGIEARLDGVEAALQVRRWGGQAVGVGMVVCRTAACERHAMPAALLRPAAERASSRPLPCPAPPQGYHAMADRLGLIPATAKRAEGVAFEVRLDRGAASAGEMINVDLKVRSLGAFCWGRAGGTAVVPAAVSAGAGGRVGGIGQLGAGSREAKSAALQTTLRRPPPRSHAHAGHCKAGAAAAARRLQRQGARAGRPAAQPAGTGRYRCVWAAEGVIWTRVGQPGPASARVDQSCRRGAPHTASAVRRRRRTACANCWRNGRRRTATQRRRCGG